MPDDAVESRVDKVGDPPGAVVAPAAGAASPCRVMGKAGGVPPMLLAIACLYKVDVRLERFGERFDERAMNARLRCAL